MRPSPRLQNLADPDAEALEVAVFWRGALLGVHHVADGKRLSIGGPGADLVLPGVEPGERLLVEAGFVLSLPDDARVGHAAPGADGVAELGVGGMRCLEPGETLSIRWHELSLSLRRVEQAPAPPRLSSEGARGHGFVAASLLVHGAMLLMFSLTPPAASALSLERLHRDSRATDYLLVQPSVEEDAPEWTPDPGESGEAAAGEAGEAGDPKAPARKRRATRKGPRDNSDPAITLAEARQVAETGGLIGVLKGLAPTEAGSIFGRERAIGADPETLLGGLLGEAGSAYGKGGLAMLGTGRGGGGGSYGTMGTGPLGTIGVGPGGGGTGYGDPRSMRMRRRESKVPQIRPEPPVVKGSLAKETIRRVVRRNLAQVRHCYEQRLSSRPDLEGRVAIRFLIGPTGVVRAAAVAESSLGDVRAEHCIARVVQRLTFPAPDGGGLVSVTYPFQLQNAGG